MSNREGVMEWRSEGVNSLRSLQLFSELKRYPFRAEPPRRGHYGEYPPPPPRARGLVEIQACASCYTTVIIEWQGVLLSLITHLQGFSLANNLPGAHLYFRMKRGQCPSQKHNTITQSRVNLFVKNPIHVCRISPQATTPPMKFGNWTGYDYSEFSIIFYEVAYNYVDVVIMYS